MSGSRTNLTRLLRLLAPVALLLLTAVSLVQASAPILPGSGTWSTDTPLSRDRIGCGCVGLGGKLYAVGGWTSAGLTDSAEAFDPTTSTWASIAPMNNARANLGLAVLDGNIYAVGGSYHQSVEVYDPLTDAWSMVASMAERRQGLAAVALGGKIYAIGGHKGGHPLASVESYDPAADSWSPVASLNVGRLYTTAVALKGKIYVCGGENYYNPGPDRGPLASVEVYDPGSDTWSHVTPMPNARLGPGATVLNGRIFVIGGAARPPEPWYRNTLFVYDPATDVWSTGTSMRRPRYQLAAATLGHHVYAVGGHRSTSLVERYDPPFIEVDVDVKPGSTENAVNLGSHGVLPVAILSSGSFDATRIDPSSLALSGASVAVRGSKNRLQVQRSDVDGDGLVDLLVHFETADLSPEEIEEDRVSLTGVTVDGLLIHGQDSIRIVP